MTLRSAALWNPPCRALPLHIILGQHMRMLACNTPSVSICQLSKVESASHGFRCSYKTYSMGAK